LRPAESKDLRLLFVLAFPAKQAGRPIQGAVSPRLGWESTNQTAPSYLQNVYPSCTWMLAFTPGFRSPSDAEEICTAFTPRSMDRFSLVNQ